MTVRPRYFVAMTVFAIAAALAAAARASAATPLLWGAHVEASIYGYPFEDLRATDTLESRLRKRMAVLGFTRHWQNAADGTWQPFDRARAEAIRQRGAVPMMTWAPGRGTKPDQPDFRTAVIAGGAYDAYLRSFATDVAAYGHSIFIRLGWEMDGWWYPWAEGKQADGTITNGNRPGDYAAMYRHVRAVFDAAGATNVTWVWATNHETTGPTRYPPLSQVYPGDAAVDWTGMDPYNRYPPGWTSFEGIIAGVGTTWLSNTYQRILAVAPSKPMMLAEFGSYEDTTTPGRKAAWLRDLPAVLARYPAIRMAMYYHAHDATVDSVHLESSATARQAFADVIGTEGFVTNSYRDATGKITPPGPATRVISPAIADSYTDASAPTAPYGSATRLQVDGSPVRKTFLKFDLTPLAGRALTSARLRVAGGGDATAAPVTIRRVDQTAWNERYITAANTVTPTSITLGTFPGIPATGTTATRLDLLDTQPRVGGILSVVLETGSSDGATITSRETATPPALEVTYQP